MAKCILLTESSIVSEDGAPVCAVCGVHENLSRCSRCKVKFYCSVKHQREHFPQHKLECRSSSIAASSGIPCLICLKTDPPPIVSGCDCLGQKLAHVDCRAQYANSGDATSWWKCPACGCRFSGQMRHELARRWWAQVSVLAAESPTRLGSANNFADSLMEQGSYVEAETMLRVVLNIRKVRQRNSVAHRDTVHGACSTQRVDGDDHPSTMTTASNLASSLSRQEKLAEAEAILHDVLVARTRVHGDDHPETCLSADNLAYCLGQQGRHAEAELVLRRLLEVQQRTLGLQHADTLNTAAGLAFTLTQQGKPEAG
jgi:hypothetical protein